MSILLEIKNIPSKNRAISVNLKYNILRRKIFRNRSSGSVLRMHDGGIRNLNCAQCVHMMALRGQPTCPQRYSIGPFKLCPPVPNKNCSTKLEFHFDVNYVHCIWQLLIPFRFQIIVIFTIHCYRTLNFTITGHDDGFTHVTLMLLCGSIIDLYNY